MNIKIQCCGIILLTVILYFYLCRRKIKLKTSQAFLHLSTITMVQLLLDILSVVLLTYHRFVPELLVDFVCKSYLSSLVLLAMFAYLYICTDTYSDKKKFRRVKRVSSTISVIGIVMIFLLPIYKYLDDIEQVYTYGPSVICTYVFAVFFLLQIVLLLVFGKRKIDSRRWNAMLIWIILWLAAAGTQFVFNELLLVGFASTVGVAIVFLMLENPELNTDISTGLFNREGMLLYVDQLFQSEKPFSAIDIVLPKPLTTGFESEESRIVRVDIIHYLLSIADAYAFLYKEDEVVILLEDREKAETYLAAIKERFEKGWGKSADTVFSPRWRFIPNGSIANKSMDVIRLLEYARMHRAGGVENYTVIIDDRMLETMHNEEKVEHLIAQALEQDRVEVFYQPIYSTVEKRFTAAEALVRLHDPDGKLIFPGDFIDVAEQNGSILRLGEMVFEKVCRFIRDQKPEQYGLDYVEVNLSVVQCASELLAPHFIGIMQKYGIAPERINLEITETASVETKKVLLDNMSALIRYGVTFSLDDFGTGQSNLNYIVEMPVEIVKFDRSMTMSYFENGKAKYVMDAAMRMIHGMKQQIVAEGIEKKEHFDIMNELGIRYMQGYYFSKPLPEAQFLAFLSQNNGAA